MEITEKKRNKNAIRSVNMIVDAYMYLLTQLPEEKITVTAIVNRAGLNRSTFYAHFGCPEDVHKLLEERLIDELFQNINGLDIKGLMKNPEPLLKVVSDLIESRKSTLKLFFENHTASNWIDSIKEGVIEKFIADTDTADMYADREMLVVNIRFFVGGYMSLCRDYISNKIDKPLSELTGILAATIAGGLATGIKARS